MLKKDLAVVLFCEDAKIRYGWVFLQMEMLKYGTAEVFFHWKCWNKVRPVCYIVKKAKLKYAWCCLLLKMLTFKISGGFFYWKCWNKVLMGFCPIKNAKTRYGWRFILFEMLKKGAAKARLGSSKSKNKIRLRL